MSRSTYKNILCIRADNMGDIIMTTPAFRALKETFNCRITLLTSRMGSIIAPFIKDVDESITCNLPWVKSGNALDGDGMISLKEKLEQYNFDAAIIFTVYSQNALPAALLLYMANIPLRLAYCRENPYYLLTHWIPDKEPYSFIQHQVERDLKLVEAIGAKANNNDLDIAYNKAAYKTALKKLSSIGFNADENFIIAHPGVSEDKRRYPVDLWIEALNRITQETGVQVLLTGSKNEQVLTETICQGTGDKVFNTAGVITLEESIAMIAEAALVISVNTSTVHIAAALKKPVVDLYAQTNPQHTPWHTKNVVLPFSVPDALKSKNEVIEFVNRSYYNDFINYPSPVSVANAALQLLVEDTIMLQPIFSS